MKKSFKSNMDINKVVDAVYKEVFVAGVDASVSKPSINMETEIQICFQIEDIKEPYVCTETPTVVQIREDITKDDLDIPAEIDVLTVKKDNVKDVVDTSKETQLNQLMNEKISLSVLNNNSVEESESSLCKSEMHLTVSSTQITHKAVDNKVVDNKAVDNKAVDNKAVDNKVVNNKAVDNKAVDNKAVDNKAVGKSVPNIIMPSKLEIFLPMSNIGDMFVVGQESNIYLTLEDSDKEQKVLDVREDIQKTSTPIEKTSTTEISLPKTTNHFFDNERY